MKKVKDKKPDEGAVTYLREPQVRKKIGGISKTTLWRWVREGHFPKPVRLGVKCVAWRPDEIDQWINTRPAYDEKNEEQTASSRIEPPQTNNPADFDAQALEDFCLWYEQNRETRYPTANRVDGFDVLVGQAILSFLDAKSALDELESLLKNTTRMTDEEAKDAMDKADEMACAAENIAGTLRLYREYSQNFSSPLRLMLMEARKARENVSNQ